MKRVIDYCQLLTGKLSGTMTHDLRYDFLRMGRNMECTDMTTRVIDVRATNLLPNQTDESQALRGYPVEERARFAHGLSDVPPPRARARALRFLLQEKDFPRSVQYCLTEIEHCLHRLPGNEAALRVLGRARRMVQEIAIDRIVRRGLDDFIDDLRRVHGELHEQLTATYFTLQGCQAS